MSISIDTKTLKLPTYPHSYNGLTGKELFLSLIEENFKSKILDKLELNEEQLNVYLDRVEEEIGVIEDFGVIDYFLNLWDVCQFCDREGIIRGIGRGSAGGSLISYLLNITHVDPVEYKLLFSRFLNAGRMGKPEKYEVLKINDSRYIDIDSDIVISRNGKQQTIKGINLHVGDEIISP